MSLEHCYISPDDCEEAAAAWHSVWPKKMDRGAAKYREEEELVSSIVLVGEDTHGFLRIAKEIRGVTNVLLSQTGLELINYACQCPTSFVLANFDGEIFTKLRRAQVRIIGPTLLVKCSRENLILPLNARPLFCFSMHGLSLCFTGFTNKTKLVWLVNHVHYMGGCVKKDTGMSLTHMVANVTQGEKYRYAVNMGKPIMCEDWITQLWANRDDPDSMADHPKMVEYRMKPFYQCCLSFLGFTKEERQDMEELTLENGGTFADLRSSRVTHLIVDDQTIKEVPPDIQRPRFIVRGEWFWGCIHMAACADEKIYAFEKTPAPVHFIRRSHAMTKNRKRKILRELVKETEGSSFIAYKRRSSSADVSGASPSSDSFLDDTFVPDKPDIYLADLKIEHTEDTTQCNTAKLSKRHMVAMELLQTELNYVGILHTILHTFKAQIENPDQYNGPILAAQDIKIIFGNIPPIYEVHCKLKDSLSFLIENWSEYSSVGDCIINRADELIKAYPPFVNFFENTKETMQRCDSSNPRFHAFLKLCLSKSECGRQSLQELLIRPVQRLPSIILLLQDLLKRTESNNPDKCKLELAIEKVKTVMTHINEDKRRTESQVVMFDIINDIDGCPATLLSSNRHFVMKVDVLGLSDNLSSRGDPLTLFIFSDSVEICKRRLKVIGSTSKTPAVIVTHSKSSQKAYKHLVMVPMTSIKRVVDLEETVECCLAFGLICRESSHSKEKLYSFALTTNDVSKVEVLTAICRNVAIVLCRPDIETFMARVDGIELHINTNDLHRGSMTSKFGRKVSQAFSNRTPSKLTRAVSGIIHGLSPFARDSSKLERGGRKQASSFDLTDISTATSDTSSLGALSLQDSGSNSRFLTTSSATKPNKTPIKWATIAGKSPGKGKYL